MKYIISIICTMFVGTSFATTVNIDWVSNGNTYDQTTCQTGGNFTLPAQNPTKYGHHFVGWHFDEITGTGSQNGTPTPTNPIYPTFMPLGNTVLRAVGDVADTYDPTTGLITRRVGVKVLDGTENWLVWGNGANYTYRAENVVENANSSILICSHLKNAYGAISNMPLNSASHPENALNFYTRTEYSSTTEFKQYLADQYNAGTPVTVYYPLATPTTETLQ